MSYPVLLPNNSTAIELALAQLDADGIGGLDAQIIRRVHSIDETPEKFLPYLAWERSVDEWNPAWSIDIKREVVRSSYEIHRFKGTAWAVLKAIEATGLAASLEEWFEYDGDPYKFRLTINLSEQSVTPTDLAIVVRVVLRTKNARSLLETILFLLTKRDQQPFIGMAIRVIHHTRISPEAV